MIPPSDARRLETFSYLPPLTAEDVVRQIEHILDSGLIPAIEFTTSPNARDTFWSLWKLPLFEARSPEQVLAEIDACCAVNTQAYVKLNGYDPKRQGQVASFVVRRPT